MTLFNNPLDIPLAGEAGAALAHGGRRLRKTLDALRRYDAAGTIAGVSSRDATERNELVAEAGDALWCYVVHREILGLLDIEYIISEYAVPAEVRKSMAPRRRSGG